MNKLIAVLLVSVVCGIGLDVMVRLNGTDRSVQTNENRPLRTPISTRLLDIQKHGRGMSEDEAKAISLEIWNELWGPTHNVKVDSCKRDEDGLWEVSIVLPRDKQLTASDCGCVVTLSAYGIDRIQYCGGM